MVKAETVFTPWHAYGIYTNPNWFSTKTQYINGK